MSTQAQPTIIVPEGFSLHSENTAHILLPNDNGAFLNPVQEFNRDLSVACIRTWGDQMNELRRSKWAKKLQKKMNASKPDSSEAGPSTSEGVQTTETPPAGPSAMLVDAAPQIPELKPHKFVILEALSATGLRSIRYAKEIPLVKYVIANDLSSSATEAMRRNVEINGLGPQPITEVDSTEPLDGKQRTVKSDLGKVRVNEGDACALMYNHRLAYQHVDVVDLDPYGTAAPFIDAAVQCVNDGGLLCVTCTDMSVLATTNYPEKCYSNYGGIPLKAEYCHEAALRLVLHTISTSAARYGRYIQPLLSLSIDFYVRLFVRLVVSPLEVKKIASKTSIYYICTHCQSFYDQPFGRLTKNVHEPSGQVNYSLKTHAGPTVSDRCPECNSALHLAGPMWSGPLHDQEYISKVLDHVEENEDKYGTVARMKGMLTVAKEELDTPFYFTPSKLSRFFHCTCPALNDVVSALLHAGHTVSRSHACAGSLKTTAPRADVHDIFRSWVKEHPVKMDKIAPASPSRILLAKEPKAEANFTHHPQALSQASKVKLVRYQTNPTPNWGPGTKAASGTKRKRTENDE